jgi:lysozyme family protein
MKLETDPLLQLPTGVAIAKCLRAMDSPENSAVFAAVLALRRVLFYKNKTFDDFARCVEAWFKYLRKDAKDLATEAMQEAAAAAEVLAEQCYAHGDDDTDVDSDRRKHAESSKIKGLIAY